MPTSTLPAVLWCVVLCACLQLAWTRGSVLFASGSPFPPAACPSGALDPITPAQCNNAYVFPAIGHAAVLTRARSIPDSVFLLVAEALASLSPPSELAHGHLFPPFRGIRAVSAALMAAVCAHLVEAGVGSPPEEGFDGDWLATCRAAMWDV